MSKNISGAKSFEGWNPKKFIIEQKKTIIALIGTGLGYIITNNEVIAGLSGLIFAGLISGIEYYFKKIDNR